MESTAAITSVPTPEEAAAEIQNRREYQRNWARRRREVLIEQAAKAGVIVKRRGRSQVHTVDQSATTA